MRSFREEYNSFSRGGCLWGLALCVVCGMHAQEMGCMVWGKGWGGTHRCVCVARGCVAREMETVGVR